MLASVTRTNTGCGRINSHILKGNKNQMKQGTQKILLFIKSTYGAIFFSNTSNDNITQVAAVIDDTLLKPLKLSMALRVIAGGMAATFCHIASFSCSIVPGRHA